MKFFQYINDEKLNEVKLEFENIQCIFYEVKDKKLPKENVGIYLNNWIDFYRVSTSDNAEMIEINIEESATSYSCVIGVFVTRIAFNFSKDEDQEKIENLKKFIKVLGKLFKTEIHKKAVANEQ